MSTPQKLAKCNAEGEPVWQFRLEPAGAAMRKMEKEGKTV